MKNIALVIGNNDYAGHGRLENAVNDAKNIANELSKLGFSVDTVYDGTSDQIREAISRLRNELDKSLHDTGLFFYSGHGMQVRDENFVIPINIDVQDGLEATDKLVRVKEIIDTISTNTQTRLIFLDACRDNPFSSTVLESNERSRSWENVSEGAFDVSGLAEIDSPSGTLIAFAAAPGKTATDHGELGNSPFTQALVENIASVDLPLTNLLHRISDEVNSATNGAQQPWYHSSLTLPYFFNPGALITLTGNLLALVAVAMSLVIFGATLIDEWDSAFSIAGALTVSITVAILIFGFNRAYQRLRGSKQRDELTPTNFFGLIIQKGVLGAALGGIITAPIMAIPYYFLYRDQVLSDNFGNPERALEVLKLQCAKINFCGSVKIPELDSLGRVVIEMVIAGVSLLAILGFACWVGASMYWNDGRLCAVSLPSKRHLVVGSLLGGVATGLIAGPLVTTYFAYQIRPIADPQFLAPFAIFGCAVISFALINYSLEKISLKQVFRSAMGSLIGVAGAGLVGFAVFGPLYQLGVVEGVIAWMSEAHERHNYEVHSETTFRFLIGGLIYGFFLGVVLGSVFIFARYFTPGEVAISNEAQEIILWQKKNA